MHLYNIVVVGIDRYTNGVNVVSQLWLGTEEEALGQAVMEFKNKHPNSDIKEYATVYDLAYKDLADLLKTLKNNI